MRATSAANILGLFIVIVPFVSSRQEGGGNLPFPAVAVVVNLLVQSAFQILC